MKFKLEDEKIVFTSKHTIWNKFWLYVLSIIFTFLSIVIFYKRWWYTSIDLLLIPFMAYWFIQLLFGKIIVTNKRILFHNFFFLIETINLKNIKDIWVDAFPNNNIIEFQKIIIFSVRKLPVVFFLSNGFEFKNRIIAYTKDIPDNSLKLKLKDNKGIWTMIIILAITIIVLFFNTK